MSRRSVFRSALLGLPVLLVLAGAAPKPAPVSTHETAARDLVLLIHGDELAWKNSETRLQAILAQDPEQAPYEDVYRAWYRKVFGESDLESDVVQLYMERFSEKELREMAAFYRTPAGRKMISIVPDLLGQADESRKMRAEEHAAELFEMLEKAREERERQHPIPDEVAQKRTVADIRNVGTAMFSWLTDQVGAGAAGQSQTEEESGGVDLDLYSLLSAEELQEILVPQYMQHVPKKDGWGHLYEYYLNSDRPLDPQVMSIRSPGRDGRFSDDTYTVTSFDPSDFDEDIVWADGFFARWPQAKPR